MRALQIAVFMLGALCLAAPAAYAQTQSGTAAAEPAKPSATETAPATGAQRVLTPEQIEELQSMVARMQKAMQDMVASARSTAGRLADGTPTIVVSTNEVAAIAIGAAGGAIIIDLLGGGGLATMAGAVVGGVAAHWLMTTPPPVTTAAAS